MAEKLPPDALRAEFTPDFFGLRLTGLIMRRGGDEVDVLRHAVTPEEAAWVLEYLAMPEEVLSLMASPSRRKKSCPSLLGNKHDTSY